MFFRRKGLLLMQYSVIASGSRHVSTKSVTPDGSSEIVFTRANGTSEQKLKNENIAQKKVLRGITVHEYSTRRHKLLESLLRYTSHCNRSPEQHIVIIPSATKLYMTDSIPYPFRQNSDFSYLTGFHEPDSVLVLHCLPKQNSALSYCATIFVPKRDAQAELWDGPRLGPEGAVSLLGVDEAFNISQLPDRLSELFRQARNTALWFDTSNCKLSTVNHSVQSAIANDSSVLTSSPRQFLHELRLIKSPAEVGLIIKSCEIAGMAFKSTMACNRHNLSEHHLWAKIDFECRFLGAERLAYPPVVAGGSRATIIHYINNNCMISADEMVLMDAGCEYDGYVSDVTRTWPVSGKFLPNQQALYEVVEDCQTFLLKLANEHRSLDEIYECMITRLGVNLQQLGVISKGLNSNERNMRVIRYCPHHVGHYLGMDVHDTSLIPRNRTLIPGMVITLEPGVYLPANDAYCPNEFKGMGIRIEDDLLVTSSGVHVLTADCPKSVTEVEKTVNSKSQ